MTKNGSTTILVGDVSEKLAGLDAASVQCCVTSPPYWGLRDYGCEGQIGLEPTPAEFVARLVGVFREVRRVLRPDGVCFVNLGDSYASGEVGRHDRSDDADCEYAQGRQRQGKRQQAKVKTGLRPKSLVGIPSRFALAMQDDGWIWRSMMPWVKRSAMPESVRDRPSSAIEYWLMFTQEPRYFWDAEAVRRAEANPGASARQIQYQKATRDRAGEKGEKVNHSQAWGGERDTYKGGRAFRNTDLLYESLTAPHGLIQSAEGDPLALDVNPQAFGEAHFATFPEKLVEPLIRAATSEKGQWPRCGTAWVRRVESSPNFSGQGRDHIAGGDKVCGQGWEGVPRATLSTTTLGGSPTCGCYSETAELSKVDVLPPQPQTVLDPFCGSGTTLLVAARLGRDAIGIELSSDYAAMAERRIGLALRPATFCDPHGADAGPLFEGKS